MNDFFEEISEGEISVRDRHQFELKVDYAPDRQHPKNIFALDFYFFIPGALQINANTYSKDQFYQDLTTLIRFKTPNLSFSELLDKANQKSPLTRLHALCLEDPHLVHQEMQQELKLLANIVRSRLREEIKKAIEAFQKEDAEEIAKADQAMIKLCADFVQLQKRLNSEYQVLMEKIPGHVLIKYWSYVDEFLTMTASDFFLGLLHEMRETPAYSKRTFECDAVVCAFIKQQKDYCNEHGYRALTPEISKKDEGEFFIYRKGLLRKFVLDVLLLHTERKELTKQYSHINHIVAAFAAGVAMLVYLLIFVWHSNSLIITSAPFILGTVFLYILKDRLKEEIKTVSSRIFKWFPDYTTMIKSPDAKEGIGKLTESFHFVSEQEIPQDILECRHKEFHQELVEAKRIETVFKYAKSVTLNKQFFDKAGRDVGLTDIFRFNIADFLNKASEPHVEQLYLDEQSDVLETLRLRKVYHINVIIQDTYMDKEGKEQTLLRKVRLILDKDGIVRMETIPS